MKRASKPAQYRRLVDARYSLLRVLQRDKRNQSSASRSPGEFQPSVFGRHVGVHDDPQGNALHLDCWRTRWSDSFSIMRRGSHAKQRKPGRGLVRKSRRRSSTTACSRPDRSPLPPSRRKASILRQRTLAATKRHALRMRRPRWSSGRIQPDEALRLARQSSTCGAAGMIARPACWRCHVVGRQ
jgi:hypothetical protein